MTGQGEKRGGSHTGHLARVRALADEFEAAILALEKNDIKLLEQTLAKQERLCHDIVAAYSLPASSELEPSPHQSTELRNAYVALAQKKGVYSALLRRSERTVSLLGALYRCYGSGRDKKSQNEHSTWSCEV